MPTLIRLNRLQSNVHFTMLSHCDNTVFTFILDPFLSLSHFTVHCWSPYYLWGMWHLCVISTLLHAHEARFQCPLIATQACRLRLLQALSARRVSRIDPLQKLLGHLPLRELFVVALHLWGFELIESLISLVLSHIGAITALWESLVELGEATLEEVGLWVEQFWVLLHVD